MIRLSKEQRNCAREGFNQLEGRWSSHLTTDIDGASAGGEDWQFLRGYKELLVKIEKLHAYYYLMLKCEGHTLNEGVGHSILHGLSWVSKKVTGSGNDVNPDFVRLIKDENNSNLGISKRGAENYSNKYKALLKTLQKNHKKRMNKTLKGGEIVPVHEVVEALVDACWAYIRFNRHTSTTMEGMFLAKLAYAGGTNILAESISQTGQSVGCYLTVNFRGAVTWATAGPCWTTGDGAIVILNMN